MQTFTQINEAWSDVYSAAEAMKKHPKAWIHFTSVAKLGVNPNKNHHDPHGIYFYPISWLLYSDEVSSSQYATSKKYYYIVELNKKANIVDLNKLDDATATAYADKNGWLEYYQKGKANPRVLIDNCQASNPKKVKTAGFLFFTTADVLVNRPEELGAKPGQFTWSTLFAGIAGMKDRYGIINMNEPEQAFVVSNRDFKVIAFGENKNKEDSVSFDAFKAAISTLADPNTPTKIGWKYQVPNAQILYKGGKYTIVYSMSGINIERHDLDGTIVPFYTRITMSEVNSDYSLDTVISNLAYAVKRALDEVSKIEVPASAKGIDFLVIAEYAKNYFMGSVSSRSKDNALSLSVSLSYESRLAINIHETGVDFNFSSLNGLDADVKYSIKGTVSVDAIIDGLKTVYDMTLAEMYKKYIGIPTDPERLTVAAKRRVGIK